jgi:copper(I)-binding protein
MHAPIDLRPKARVNARTLGVAAVLLSAVLLVVAVVSGAFAAGKPAAPAVSEAWAQFPPVPGRPGAAYLTLKAGPADTLVAVASPIAAYVEMHTTKNVNGVMKMQRTGSLVLAGGATLKMAPGGYHLMLFGVDTPPAPGTSFPLTLSFEKAGPVTVQVPVRAFGQGKPAAPMNHDMHHDMSGHDHH